MSAKIGLWDKDMSLQCLSKKEWELLEKTIEKEINSEDHFLDEYTKWTYNRENGTSVFAFYGIGSGKEPTVLDAFGGLRADEAYNRFIKEQRSIDDESKSDRNRSTLDRLFENIKSKQDGDSKNIRADGNRKAADGNVRVSIEESRGNGRTNTERSEKNSTFG